MSTEDAVRLRNYIDGVAGAGGQSRLPPEPRLSEALGISRGRLRTLLKKLEQEGLIWRHVGKGTFVGPRRMDLQDASWTASISLRDIVEARLILEPQLAAQAAINATPADMADMTRCLAEMADATAFLQWKRLDEKLHRSIANAAHNPVLLMLYDTMRLQARLGLDARIEEIFSQLKGPKASTDAEHRQLVEAIRTHDPAQAERAMRAHLVSVRDALFGLR